MINSSGQRQASLLTYFLCEFTVLLPQVHHTHLQKELCLSHPLPFRPRHRTRIYHALERTDIAPFDISTLQIWIQTRCYSEERVSVAEQWLLIDQP